MAPDAVRVRRRPGGENRRRPAGRNGRKRRCARPRHGRRGRFRRRDGSGGDVDPLDVPETAERFFEEWKARGKEIESLKEELATARASGGADAEEIDIGDATAVIQRVDSDADELRATANAHVDDGKVAVIGSGAGGSASFVVGVPEGVDVNAGQVVSALASRVGGGGGGPPDFAQGGGPDVDRLDDALAAAPDVLRSLQEA